MAAGIIPPGYQTPAPTVEAGPDNTFSEIFQGTLPEDYGLGQSEYDFYYRTFPDDLGKQGYNNHYMVININVQEKSKMNQVTGPGGTYTTSSILQNELSKTDALRYKIDTNFTNAAGESLGQSAGLSMTNISRPRFTRRIKESIALYMPNAELTFNDAHDFKDISLTTFGATIASGAAQTFAAMVGGILGGAAGARDAASAVGTITDSLTAGAGQVAQVYGRPINPKVEVLYANTMQREHRFDFIFSPSSQKESENLRQIIRTLRFHAAPELPGGADSFFGGPGSFFWIPPAEFDITFYYRGEENTRIPRINTCALTNIDVSYSPNGTWSTFHDGYPTQIRMQLAFRETEVTHKLRVLQGF